MHKGRRRFLLLGVLLAAGVALAADEQAEVRHVALVPAGEGYVLDAEIDMVLNSRMAEAITRGVPLHFVAEFQLSQPRWYWLDRDVVTRKRRFRLSYHAITRAYRLTSGSLHRSFDTLDEAVAAMARIHRWSVIEPGAVQPGENYDAAFRFRHDQTELPRPFQVTGFGSREWVLDSGWTRWTLNVPAVKAP